MVFKKISIYSYILKKKGTDAFKFLRELILKKEKRKNLFGSEIKFNICIFFRFALCFFIYLGLISLSYLKLQN